MPYQMRRETGEVGEAIVRALCGVCAVRVCCAAYAYAQPHNRNCAGFVRYAGLGEAGRTAPEGAERIVRGVLLMTLPSHELTASGAVNARESEASLGDTC